MSQKLTKRRKKINELNIQSDQLYPVNEGLELLSKYFNTAKAKFDETVEVAIVLGIDARHSDQMVRGAVVLPKGTGKSVRVAVFTTPDKLKDAEKSGADIIGSSDLIAQVQAGKIDFDKCICTPDFMPSLAKIGKELGPRGLMPNPKLGTVTDDIKNAVDQIKKGMVEFKTGKSSIVHARVGVSSFNTSDLKDNIKALILAIVDAKPSSAKGEYLKAIYLTSSQGPAIALDKKTVLE